MQQDTASLDIDACLRRVRAGDEEAATALVSHLSPLVMKIARAHLPLRHTEGDLAQEVFARLFQRLDRYEVRTGVPFEHWVSRLAVRTCLDLLRSERRRPEVREADVSEGAENWLEYLVGSEDSPPSGRAASEAREAVERMLARLSPEDRLIVTWVDLEEKTVREIAGLTGWSAVGVRVRLFRARARLRAVGMTMRKEGDHAVV